MTGTRKRLAQGLVATIVLSGVSFMVCAFFSAQGNIWERLCIGLMIVMLGSMVGALMLVATTYVKLRLEAARLLRRPVLSDEEFALRMDDAEDVDIAFVRRFRELAARRFRRLGGEKFYPSDHLEEDLHLSDLAPFGLEDFFAELEESLRIDHDEMCAWWATRGVKTFGELIASAAALTIHAKQKVHAAGADASGAVWDRALDG